MIDAYFSNGVVLFDSHLVVTKFIAFLFLVL